MLLMPLKLRAYTWNGSMSEDLAMSMKEVIKIRYHKTMIIKEMK